MEESKNADLSDQTLGSPSSSNRDGEFSSKRSNSVNADLVRDGKSIKIEIKDEVESAQPVLSDLSSRPGLSDPILGPSLPSNGDGEFPQKRLNSANGDLVSDDKSIEFNSSMTETPETTSRSPLVDQGSNSLPFNPIMPFNCNRAMNSAASTSGSSMSSGSVSSANGHNFSASSYGNTNPLFYPLLGSCPDVNNQVTTIPMFNNLGPIIINRAVLTPGERRTRRPKPPGCRTVFVGSLPEKITEEMVREAFERCGPITTIRMSKKNFCHIKFGNIESVEQALLLSGFRIRIDENEDSAFNSRIHVDYAEYECLQRARLREEQRQQEASFSPLSPPIAHFTKAAAQLVAEKLRGEESYMEGLQMLVTWLNRGECNQRNSATFFLLIQSVHSLANRLRSKKLKAEEEVDEAKENSMNIRREISSPINEIEKVFEAAKIQKVWDFSTRRRIETMRSNTLRLKEDLVTEIAEEESSLSSAVEGGEELNGRLAEELESFKTENSELKEEILRLRLELENCRRNEAAQASQSVTENEQQLISLAIIFLHSHPFGASIDYLCSYLDEASPSNDARDVESLLRRFPRIFKQVSKGIGATLVKKWMFVGFNSGN